MLFPISLLLLKSLLEKQEKANSNQRPPQKTFKSFKVRMSGSRKVDIQDIPHSLDMDPWVNFYLFSVLLPDYL